MTRCSGATSLKVNERSSVKMFQDVSSKGSTICQFGRGEGTTSLPSYSQSFVDRRFFQCVHRKLHETRKGVEVHGRDTKSGSSPGDTTSRDSRDQHPALKVVSVRRCWCRSPRNQHSPRTGKSLPCQFDHMWSVKLAVKQFVISNQACYMIWYD